VLGHGRGVRGRGGISRREDERREETMEGKECCVDIGDVLAHCASSDAHARRLLLSRVVLRHLGQTPGSYRYALVDGGAPPVGRDTSDVVDLNLNRRLRYR
jgi:hypothetical protein